MVLSLVTGPATEPLTVAEVKAHLRLDTAYGEPAPTAPTVALVAPAAPGNVDDGVHRYRVTFVTADGETEGGDISAIVTVADKAVNGKVAVSAIPVGGSAVTSRKLYRTAAAGADYLFLATVADNTTTTYTDNIADADLGAACPTTNTTTDPQLNALIKVARQQAETFTRRALITQTWDLLLDCFPTELIRLPLPPLVSVESIYYINQAGTSTLWDDSLYSVDIPAGDHAERGSITLAYAESWPTTRGIANAVTVEFTAGYGAAAAVPQGIKQALLLMIGQWYDNPAAQDDMPAAAKALLWGYRALEA
ncbi:MAG TPA: hypothetical protein VM013_00450 [Dehalococcoidia bacterium]|nr:hypothetical protein [Dehalococcoidia bacterium]